MNRTADCIRQYAPDALKQQRAVYKRIKENTLEPSSPSSHNEKIQAIQSVLSELQAERKSITDQIEATGAKMTGSKAAKRQSKIVELQSAVDDISLPEPIRQRYEKELQNLTEPEVSDTLLSESSEWSRKVIDGITSWSKSDAAVVKNGDRSWLASKLEDGDRVDLGIFKSFNDAKSAIEKGTTSEEFYKKKAKPDVPLTADQKKFIEDIDIKKVAEIVAGSVKEVKGDPEAIGVATEGIIEAARKFDPSKGVRFSTFAYKSAKGKVLSYYKERSEIQSKEVSTTRLDSGEGAETETKIENVSKRDIQSAVPIKEQKVKKEEKPEPVTKPTLSDEEKQKILDRVKVKTLAEKQAEKSKIKAKPEDVKEIKTEETIDESPYELEFGINISRELNDPKVFEKRYKAWGHLMAQVVKENRAIQEKLKTDKSKDNLETLQKIHERRKNLRDFRSVVMSSAIQDENAGKVMSAVDDIIKQANLGNYNNELKIDSDESPSPESNPSRTKAQEILVRVKHDKDSARKIAQTIKDSKERESVIAHIDSTSIWNINDVIQNVIKTATPKSQTHKLAVFLNNVIKGNKRNNVIVVDPSIRVEYFDPKSGITYLKNIDPSGVTIHEIFHSITSREVSNNPKLKARVRELMDMVESVVIADKNISIDKKTISRMREAGSTSESFKNEFGLSAIDSDRGILYALLNEKEFLAQAANDKKFQQLLMGIKLPDSKRPLWDSVVDLFKMLFGIQDRNMMHEVLQIVAETASSDLSYSKPFNTAADQMFVGEKAQTLKQANLLNAKFRLSQGEDAEIIRRETGWFLDIDNFWKIELDDSKSRVLADIQIPHRTTLGEAFDHQELYKLYPSLKEISVSIRDLSSIKKTLKGGYDNISKTLYIQEGISQKEAKRVILHEIQHVIQYHENFPTGGNSKDLRIEDHLDTLDKYYRQQIKDIKATAKSLGESVSEEVDQLNERLFKLEMIKDNQSLINEINSEIDKLNTKLFSKSNQSFNEELESKIASLQQDKDMLMPDNVDSMKYDIYKLLSGEVEARNTAARAGLSFKDRRLISPKETQSIEDNFRVIRQSDSSSFDMSDSVVEKKTWKQREKVLVENDLTPDRFSIFKNFLGDRVPSFLKDIAQTSTDRLREINPKLLQYVRKFEFGINKYNVQYHNDIKDFYTKFKELDRKTQLLLKYSLFNNFPEDVEKRWELLKANKMDKSYEKVIGVLQDIHKRKQLVALGQYEEIADYFPRKVKDHIGLRQALAEDPNFGIIEAKLEEAGLNQADREKAIQDMINTGRYPAIALKKPGSEKSRKIQRVSSEWMHYYEDPLDVLVSHIYENNEAIEARRMFGDTARGVLVKKRDSLYEDLGEIPITKKKERSKIISEISLLEDKLRNYEEEWHEGIATLLSKEVDTLSANQQTEVISLIRSRLLQKGMTGVPAFLRNMSLMTVLNGPGSAITQLSDLAITAHVNGLKSLGVSLFGKSKITTKDLDLSHSMREFQTEGSAKYLDKVLKWSGLKLLDTFGKNTFMNAALERAKNQSLESFTKSWGDQLGLDTEATWKEIQSGEKTDLTRFFAFNALSEWQPISLSEMPVKYLTAGNGRIFYALKSYNIKMLNNFYRESIYRTRVARTPKERLLSIANSGKLLVILTLAGASADELKDFIFGRDVEFSDNVHNNLLKIFFLNTYMLEQGDKKGMVKTILTDTLLPPTRVADDVYSDIRNLIDSDKENTAKFLKSVPWGTLVYARFTDGAKKTNASQIKQRVSEKIKDGASISDIRSDMVKYNQWARENKEPLITLTSIRNMRKKEKKKELKG